MKEYSRLSEIQKDLEDFAEVALQRSEKIQSIVKEGNTGPPGRINYCDKG